MSSILLGRIPSLADRVSDIPPDVEGIVRKAMSLDREDRYQTVAQIGETLRETYERLSRGSPSHVPR
ncbi:MAG: hypothetical protein HY720_31310 [Planctomycetes bacterium]|nr:hypothetical protein [Planctomycetota bacterium]